RPGPVPWRLCDPEGERRGPEGEPTHTQGSTFPPAPAQSASRHRGFVDEASACREFVPALAFRRSGCPSPRGEIRESPALGRDGPAAVGPGGGGGRQLRGGDGPDPLRLPGLRRPGRGGRLLRKIRPQGFRPESVLHPGAAADGHHGHHLHRYLPGAAQQVGAAKPLVHLRAFTVLEGLLLGAVSVFFEVDVVLWALGATAFVSFGLSLFALQTRWDFTAALGFLWVLVLVLLAYGIIAAIVQSQVTPPRGSRRNRPAPNRHSTAATFLPPTAPPNRPPPQSALSRPRPTSPSVLPPLTPHHRRPLLSSHHPLPASSICPQTSTALLRSLSLQPLCTWGWEGWVRVVFECVYACRHLHTRTDHLSCQTLPLGLLLQQRTCSFLSLTVAQDLVRVFWDPDLCSVPGSGHAAHAGRAPPLQPVPRGLRLRRPQPLPGHLHPLPADPGAHRTDALGRRPPGDRAWAVWAFNLCPRPLPAPPNPVAHPAPIASSGLSYPPAGTGGVSLK
uniref:Uncharacterized protein n=1 Tax=Ornithorhynchus anatinus TaxID=9258 RepID=A0A6I8NP72_ORNAN